MQAKMRAKCKLAGRKLEIIETVYTQMSKGAEMKHEESRLLLPAPPIRIH